MHSTEGSKSAIMRVNDRVALEADGRKPHSVWSVLAKGRIRELTDPAEIETARALPLRPWTLTPKSSYFVLVPHEVTGRRVVIGSSGETS